MTIVYIRTSDIFKNIKEVNIFPEDKRTFENKYTFRVIEKINYDPSNATDDCWIIQQTNEENVKITMFNSAEMFH